MKFGIKQKAYCAVLGLAVAGFFVDRLFFTPAESEAANLGPAQTSAAPGPSRSPSGSALAAPAGESEAVPAGWLAERIRAAAPVAADNELRDVFVAPVGWRPAPKVVVATAPAPAAPKRQLLGEQFRREHHLIAVLIEGRIGRAVVDGQLVPVGGTVAGFRLVSVDRRSALFTHGDEQVSLALSDADGGAVR
jgi:hypothetical protein